MAGPTSPDPRRSFGAAPRPETASLVRLCVAFAAVYIIWGSTYLAIRFAIETLPPFLMAGTRFTTAGALLYGWMRLRGRARPTAAHWRFAAVVGALMLVGGNGGLSWAEQLVPSGVASLVIALVPIWMVLLEAVRRGGERPGAVAVAGLLVGLLGVGMLVGPGDLLEGPPIDPIGGAVLLLASLLWAAGSLHSRNVSVGGSPLLLTGMVMLTGGIELVVVGLLTGEYPRLLGSTLSLRSGLALAYLIAFGSIAAYSAYIWLMRHTAPARVATYAYVNPIVALALGAWLAGEPLTTRTLGAGALILASVLAIQLSRSRPSAERGVMARRTRDRVSSARPTPACNPE